MTDIGLHLASYFFYIVHTLLILFNLFGWLYVRTKRLNLFSLLATFVSWILLGFWKGWGYCFLTDWHYQVLRALGEGELPSSYIVFLIEKITGWSLEAEVVDLLTVGLAVLALFCSLWANFRNSE